ncbi:hypothetical protein [Altererythrobacter sp.]|uniref:hypothetical protein n=1 Tax=Altererythrobacter sp. TaxID=1872480 RepID=UPI001B278F65|nr:hypothetical protein [Altererythrobacter sp.]MBO6610148.1 hypothetical protein [Altererythrobacter sp.]
MFNEGVLESEIAYPLAAASTAISLLLGWLLFHDLRHGRSKFVHEEHSSSRAEMPLNYWLAILSKVAGLLTSLAVAILLLV